MCEPAQAPESSRERKNAKTSRAKQHYTEYMHFAQNHRLNVLQNRESRNGRSETLEATQTMVTIQSPLVSTRTTISLRCVLHLRERVRRGCVISSRLRANENLPSQPRNVMACLLTGRITATHNFRPPRLADSLGTTEDAVRGGGIAGYNYR